MADQKLVPCTRDRPPGFEALAPFFQIIAEGLSGLVDGEDFFDTLTEDAVFEDVISVPSYPRRIVGRQSVAHLYRGYAETMVLHGSDGLAVHREPGSLSRRPRIRGPRPSRQDGACL